MRSGLDGELWDRMMDQTMPIREESFADVSWWIERKKMNIVETH